MTLWHKPGDLPHVHTAVPSCSSGFSRVYLGSVLGGSFLGLGFRLLADPGALCPSLCLSCRTLNRAITIPPRMIAMMTTSIDNQPHDGRCRPKTPPTRRRWSPSDFAFFAPFFFVGLARCSPDPGQEARRRPALPTDGVDGFRRRGGRNRIGLLPGFLRLPACSACWFSHAMAAGSSGSFQSAVRSAW